MFFILSVLFILLNISAGLNPQNDQELIHPNGNSWVINDPHKNQNMITSEGIRNWSDPHDIIRTYFKTEDSGTILLSLHTHSLTGASKITISLGETIRDVDLHSGDGDRIEIGTFHIAEPGYHFIEMKGIQRTGSVFGNIQAFELSGMTDKMDITYVRDDFYWGRRGPSVHLTYETPEDEDILWFYNEITVPEGEDVIGSYFMANGFGEGYFGIQVNSERERRVLFSVWSPYDTQDPNEIPDEYKILLNKKGDGVYTGEFGNEGSGGQSYWRYMWKAGNTYRFLLKAEPVENNSTDYTAYFFAPELGEWKLIASFRRPFIQTYIRRPHSFLENFDTRTGFIPRKAFYSNQWVRDTSGKWHELTKAKFTADATARKGSRMDYAGGIENGTFFMKNCGFFNQFTIIDSWHDRTPNGQKPQINLSALP